MNVLDVLKASGAMAINELNVRLPGTTQDLCRELQILREGGLIAMDGELPASDAVTRSEQCVRLTRSGLRQALN